MSIACDCLMYFICIVALYYICLFQVLPSCDYIYSVSDEGKQHIVCLENKSCSCRRFQVEEISCAHAWAVLKSKNILPDEYCSDLYNPKIILKIYEVPVYPLSHITEQNVPEHITEEVVLPQKYKRPPRRPKKQRYKSYREIKGKKSSNSCTTCGSFGYNEQYYFLKFKKKIVSILLFLCCQCLIE